MKIFLDILFSILIYLSFQRKIPVPTPIDIDDTIQALSCSLNKTSPPNITITIPSVLLFIFQHFICIDFVCNFIIESKYPFVMEKKDAHLHELKVG